MSTPVTHWNGAPAPSTRRLEGRFIVLEKLDATRHGDELYRALEGPGADPKLWDYLPYGPFPEHSPAFDNWLAGHAASSDPYFFAVIDKASGEVQGILSLMSIVPAQGRIEIGHVTFGAPMQRSPKSTEAVYLLARRPSPSATGAWNGSATTTTPAPARPPSAWVSASKACSASTWWSRAKTVTPPGIASSTRSGRR